MFGMNVGLIAVSFLDGIQWDALAFIVPFWQLGTACGAGAPWCHQGCHEGALASLDWSQRRTFRVGGATAKAGTF